MRRYIILPFPCRRVQFGLKPGGELEISLLDDDVDKAYRNLKEKGVKLIRGPKDMHWGSSDGVN